MKTRNQRSFGALKPRALDVLLRQGHLRQCCALSDPLIRLLSAPFGLMGLGSC